MVMNNRVETITIKLSCQYDVIELLPGIVIKPVLLNTIIESSHKIPILIKLFDQDWQILNVAQEISQHYPIIINQSPKSIVYGRLNRNDLTYKLTLIVKERHDSAGHGAKHLSYHLFGIEYADVISSAEYSANDIAKEIRTP